MTADDPDAPDPGAEPDGATSAAAYQNLEEDPDDGIGIAEVEDEPETRQRTAAELERVFDVPVNVSAILGRTRVKISDLVDLQVGKILPLDRRVGEAIDIFVNDRLVARGEVVLVDDRLGVTMTEIVKTGDR